MSCCVGEVEDCFGLERMLVVVLDVRCWCWIHRKEGLKYRHEKVYMVVGLTCSPGTAVKAVAVASTPRMIEISWRSAFVSRVFVLERS